MNFMYFFQTPWGIATIVLLLAALCCLVWGLTYREKHNIPKLQAQLSGLNIKYAAAELSREDRMDSATGIARNFGGDYTGTSSSTATTSAVGISGSSSLFGAGTVQSSILNYESTGSTSTQRPTRAVREELLNTPEKEPQSTGIQGLSNDTGMLTNDTGALDERLAVLDDRTGHVMSKSPRMGKVVNTEGLPTVLPTVEVEDDEDDEQTGLIGLSDTSGSTSDNSYLNNSGPNGSGLNNTGLNGSGLNGSGLNGSGLNGSHIAEKGIHYGPGSGFETGALSDGFDDDEFEDETGILRVSDSSTPDYSNNYDDYDDDESTGIIDLPGESYKDYDEDDLEERTGSLARANDNVGLGILEDSQYSGDYYEEDDSTGVLAVVYDSPEEIEDETAGILEMDNNTSNTAYEPHQPVDAEILDYFDDDEEEDQTGIVGMYEDEEDNNSTSDLSGASLPAHLESAKRVRSGKYVEVTIHRSY